VHQLALRGPVARLTPRRQSHAATLRPLSPAVRLSLAIWRALSASMSPAVTARWIIPDQNSRQFPFTALAVLPRSR
jgi:hypothetical protein